MPSQPEDHWGKIASEFGVEITPQPPAETDSATDEAVESQSKPTQSRTRETPKVVVPPKKNAPRPVAHWDSLAGELGLEVPQREVEPEEDENAETESQQTESTPAPSVASTSHIAELLAPQDNVDEEVLELFESVQAERSDASYFAITESAAGEEEDSIEVIVEDLEEEVGIQPRRRRRRSRSRRSAQPVEPAAESQVEFSAELEIEAEAAEEILEPLTPEAQERDEAGLLEPETEEPDGSKPAEGERSRSRRRPRRRRRSKGSESGEREKEISRSAESPPSGAGEADADEMDLDDLDADDLDADDLSEHSESESRGRRSKAKKITGWIEAVSVMVDANIERHKKGDSDRSRGGRSRGRRGR